LISKDVKNRIVIITSGQPSANPRVVKEATALAQHGYNVTVVYAPLSPWADEYDRRLFGETPQINWISGADSPKVNNKHYKLVRGRRKLKERLYKLSRFFVAEPVEAFTLYAQELKKTASTIPAALYIGHNLGSLPAVLHAGRRWKARIAFDAEDFHRGEEPVNSWHYNIAKKIEDQYFPHLNYLTTASPLISARYLELYPSLSPVTVNNVFSKKYLQPVLNNKKNELKLFWFSQTVGANRRHELIV